MLISEWCGRKDLVTEHAAPHSGTRLRLLSRQRSMYLARRGSRSAILIAPPPKHVDRRSAICVARFEPSSHGALSNIEGALQPVFCEIGFHYLRRRHCHVGRSVSRIEWLGDPLATPMRRRIEANSPALMVVALRCADTNVVAMDQPVRERSLGPMGRASTCDERVQHRYLRR